MTRRVWIVAFSVLTWNVTVRAQSGPPNRREPLASQYINVETGLTLAQALARALGQEPSLRAARTEADAAKGMRLQAGLRPNPTVSLMQLQEAGGTDNQSRIELLWPLDLFRKAGRIAVADQEVQATDRAIADRERLLAAEVRMKYGQVVVAVRDLAVSDDVIALTTRQLDLLRARVDQGSTPPLERNMVDVEVRRLDAQRVVQAGQVEQAVIELKRLLALPAAAPLQLRDTLEQLVDREAASPVRPDSAAVPDRPDVQEAEARIRVADARIDRARRDGRFDLGLAGSYMRMDSSFPQFGFDANGELSRVHGVFHDVSVGAAVTVPFRNQNQGEIASAQAERAGATARRDAARLSAETEIAVAKIRDARARDAVEMYRTGARNLARQNLDVVTQTYELGRATVFDVLAEQRRYLDLELAYSKALRDAYEARTALRLALGDLR